MRVEIGSQEDASYSKKPVPLIPLDLLVWLESAYRDTLPKTITKPEDTRSIWWRAGQAHLIRRLRGEYEAQVRK